MSSPTAAAAPPNTYPNRYKPGQSGNPAGRPKGTSVRAKIERGFLRDFQALWKQHGKDILIAAAMTDPVAVMRVAAQLLPKTMEVDISEDRIVSVRLLGVEEDPNEYIELRPNEFTEVPSLEEMM